ncbi:MAG: carbon-nitrogen hydrolase family protein, partial [Candidatus Omnitrophica bacterium]|nr:carbon-nitrogen hydrolase family protein [Candidatus Omnitrophota bacterium]
RGKIISRYQKINLFDASIGRKKVNESNCFLRGKKSVICKVQDFCVGMAICYDLRFPSLFQEYRLAGAHILVVPSCFSQVTGQAHWEILLRARAIESQCYVLAPNQVGKDARGIMAYGNSMIINPWGAILARATDDKEEILSADISLRDMKIFQKVLPGIRKSV